MEPKVTEQPWYALKVRPHSETLTTLIAEGAAFLWNARRCLMHEQQEQLRGLNVAAVPVSV
jgi:hypothetical protein